jgi:hypothetical protein
MQKLIDECPEHDYIYLKNETIPLPQPVLKLVTKEIYACVYCGSGLDVYNLDEAIELPDRKL